MTPFFNAIFAIHALFSHRVKLHTPQLVPEVPISHADVKAN